MSYSNRIGIRFPHQGKDLFKAAARMRKKHRKTDAIRLECLQDAYRAIELEKGLPKKPLFLINEWLIPACEEIRKGKYAPKRPRKKKIPKSNGGERILLIPRLMDRIIAKAVLGKLTPIVDPKFDPRSHGSRPKLGVHSALASAFKAMQAGFRFVVSCDIQNAFPNTPTEAAICSLERLLGPHNCMELAKVCIRGHKGPERKLGLDQGHPLSPMAFNAFMDMFVDSTIPVSSDFVYIRYLDNLYFFFKSSEGLPHLIDGLINGLGKHGLILHADPLKDLNHEKLSFLGFKLFFDNARINISGSTPDFAWLGTALERAYDHPNTHNRCLEIVNSFTGGNSLKVTWKPEDTLKVNELLQLYGIDYRLNHLEVLEKQEALYTKWAHKFSIDFPFMGYTD